MSAAFGKYEAVNELYHSSRGGVFLGRPVGSKQKPAFAIKVFEPVILPGLATADRDGARKFLEAAQAQRSAGGKISRHSIPIFEVGDFPGGAFYVTRHYPRSLEKLIDGRVRVSSETLVHIFRSLVANLRQFEHRAGRPHGNLKASNVFVAGSGTLDKARFLLADPAAASDLGPKAGIAIDLKGLGTLLFRLVRRHDVRGEIGWPVTDSPDWTALGAKGERWRELCNQLLDPNVATQGLTWVDLDRQLRGLRFRGARRRVFALTLGLPGLVALGGFLYLRFTSYEHLPERLIDYAEFVGNVPPDSDQPPAEWALLCRAYYDWLGAMETSLQDPERRARWSKNDGLRDHVLGILDDATQRKISLDPRVIAKVSGNLPTLAAQPPDIVKKGAIRWHIQRAWKIVDQLHSELAAWPIPSQLAAASDQLTKAGFPAPAEKLKEIIAANPPTSLNADAIDQYLSAAARQNRVETVFRETENDAEVLRASQDRLLAALPEYYRQPAHDAKDLTSLADALDQTKQALAPWMAFYHATWEPATDKTRFEQESAAAKDPAPLSPERLARWQADVRDYQFLSGETDPRNQTDWSALAGQVKHSLDTYRTEEHAAVGAAKTDAVSSAALQASAEALFARVETFKTARQIRKDIAAVATQTKALADEHRTMIAQVSNALVRLHPDVTDWLKWISGQVFPESPPLQEVWETRAHLLLGDVTAAQLTEDAPRFRTLRDQARTLQIFLTALASNQVLPPPEVTAPDIRDDFRSQLNEWLKTERDNALTGLLNAIDWNGSSPRGTTETVVASANGVAARNAYTAAREAAAGLGLDYTRLAADLNAGRGLDEGIGETEKIALSRAAAASQVHQGAIGAVTASLEELHRLNAETDHPALSNRAAGGALAGSIAAWRRLGALPDWPRDSTELNREFVLEKALHDRVARVDRDSDRQTNWQEELNRESRARWNKALRNVAAANSSVEVAAVFGRMAEFGLTETDLDESARYNLYLSNLKTDMLGVHTAEEAAGARTRFVQSIQGLTTANARPEAAAFTQALQNISLVAGNPVEDLKKLGLAQRGWTAEPNPDATRIIYRWTSSAGQPHELTFLLVDLTQNDPFFLATTEMPIGLFLDQLASHPDQKFVATYMASWIPNLPSPAEDQRQGPQVWAVDFRQPGRIRLNSKWTGVKMPSWPDQVYANGAAVPPPSRLSPVQYIDPAAARAFAENILGCRLPTPAEWTELIQVLGGPDQVKKASWNLRDQTWQAQQAYLVKAGAAFDLPWPDADIFIPAPLKNIARAKDALSASPSDDGVLWFNPVTTPNPATPFSNLLGNVAEFLWDPKTHTYGVAGGSALSPAELDPTAISAVDTQPEREGYSDVGFRPAFSAPDSLVGKSRVSRLTRDQAFLRL